VQVQIQGSGVEWRMYDDWPPPAVPTRWYLQPAGGLSPTTPPESAPDRHRYDPADPTPAIGGIGMLTGGTRDNRELEARDDVLVYTSAPLGEPLVVLGPVAAELHVASTGDFTDFFVRLCDVHPDGRSLNVCDGLQRYTPETIERADDGSFVARVDLWPAGHRFGAGHRLRIQVSAGAHPVYARNLGTGEPPLRATAMQQVEHIVHHDPARPSCVVLPHATQA
jgi:putative CocE/NonD family hydrolase